MNNLVKFTLNKSAARFSARHTSVFSRASVLNMSQAQMSTTPNVDDEASHHVHFRASTRPHPLPAIKPKEPRGKPLMSLGDHTGLQQNHIWTPEELEQKMSTLYHYKPKTFTDKVMNKLMFTLYHSFNFITGYTPINPSVQAMQWRLIVLESVAGVPGFVAAGFRHFRSLRRLQRDHGWIATLLEEAENERMHLLICLSTFKATPLTRGLVITAQYMMTPILMSMYLINPKSMHRFVGYLEETGKYKSIVFFCFISMHLMIGMLYSLLACSTYVNTIKHVETPGTKLNEAWGNLPAPEMAVNYYHLPADAKWVDSLKCMVSIEQVLIFHD